MSRVILITGGCRSGKSVYAQQCAEALPGRHAFVATCPVLDDEMAARIRRHQADRRHAGWDTLEATVDLAALIAGASHDVLLVDCLTLWVNNVMYEDEQRGVETSEDDIVRRAREVAAACDAFAGTAIFVTNEVGMGIVPDNALARRYRDLAGRCNQTIAARAQEVVLVSCGIPLKLKEE